MLNDLFPFTRQLSRIGPVTAGRSGKPCFLFSLILLLISLPWNACAENSLDIFFGNSRTYDSSIHIKLLYVTPEIDIRYNISDSADIYGIRGIHWLDSDPNLGIGLGLAAFQAETADISTQVVPLSIMAAYRWKLDPFRLYAGTGASLVYYTLDTQYQAALGEAFSESNFDSGWEIFAGISWQLNENISWFFEYKHTDIDITSERRAIYLPPLAYGTVTEKLDGKLKSNHLMLGISLLF